MDKTLRDILTEKHRTALPGVLIAAAECAPLSKTGGLADVVGALSRALAALGFDARVITPYHRCIKEKYADRTSHVCDFYIDLGWRHKYVGLERLEVGGLIVYLVDDDDYFGDRIYRGGREEGEQYCFFQRAALECLPYLDFRPEVLHCNDWHTALMPFLLRSQYAGRPQGALRTVLTIHNIAFQGKFDLGFVQELLGVGPEWYNPSAIEHYGCVNFLKAGCAFADRVTTVSPGYAREICTPEFGEGLEQVLISRGGDMCGILNGLDTVAFDPQTDPALPVHYSAGEPGGKREAKLALISELGLSAGEDTPVIAMVTRMTAQKGFDLVLEGFDRLMESGCAFVLLGTGDGKYESFMRGAAGRYPGRVCARLTYDESLAHRIYAGADFLLMPSAFEPCGLSQMIAMRYGALPIVHEVGGLRDTVRPYNEFTGEGNGFSFSDYSAGAMLGVIGYALGVYRRSEELAALHRRAMETDFSFGPSALKYAALFLSILPGDPIAAVHLPWDERYRAPFGAVRCGERVELRIETSENCAEAGLAVGDELIAMEKCPGGFRAVYTAPAEPRVVWYSFRLGGGLSLDASGVTTRPVQPFQLTVYDGGFETPDWAKGAVMYQIFPDRYRRAGAAPVKGAAWHRKHGRTIELHKSWHEPVKWEGGESYSPNDFYGGTLSGIEQSLEELKDLGVDVIYLNPIFEADSNHRYNTADYMKIDPILGTESAFRRLCKRAESLGMRVILDGVFSHTGSDSVYFNRAGAYPEPGAYQGESSPYYSWYDFRSFPDDYRCWWGFKTLPEVVETDLSWQDFVITGEQSVVKTWLERGASGYRLDVADELPDGTLELMRRSIKGHTPSALIIGEVWEDATTKVSYGLQRRYALGRALDSVMNYPLRTALRDFALGRMDAFGLRDFLLSQKLNYPAPMYHCLMNLLSTHDTARIRSVLGSGTDGAELTRAQQAAFRLTEEQQRRGKKLQLMCVGLQFALPGMPCVYYGDEEGMQGLRDPFCRAPYERLESDTRKYYASLAALRHGSAVLRRGDAAFAAPSADVICVLRYEGRRAYMIAANRGETPYELSLGYDGFRGCTEKALASLPPLPELTLPPQQTVYKKLK